LATRARVFEDDAEFIAEVREGVAEADLVPLAELRRLGARFESWKRDFKERLRETRAVLRRADERDADAEADAAAIARDVASAARVASSPRRDETGWTEVEADKRAPEKKRRGWGLKRALGLKR
jgi:myosin-5